MNTVLSLAAHILKYEQYRKDQYGPCTRDTLKKTSIPNSYVTLHNYLFIHYILNTNQQTKI